MAEVVTVEASEVEEEENQEVEAEVEVEASFFLLQHKHHRIIGRFALDRFH